MSQQRILSIVCVLGACVAMASAQSFDMDNCQKTMRSELDQYSKALRGAGRKFAEGIQSSTESMMDTTAFDEDIDKMVESFSSLLSQGTNFDAGRLSSVYMENLGRMQSMMTTAFRMYMKMPQSAMSSYMELGQSVMSAQSRLMQSLTNGCTPRTKLQAAAAAPCDR